MAVVFKAPSGCCAENNLGIEGRKQERNDEDKPDGCCDSLGGRQGSLDQVGSRGDGERQTNLGCVGGHVHETY